MNDYLADYNEDSAPATMSQAVAEYAANVGQENRERAWILSPFDSWERNPFYNGPAVKHPEELADEDMDELEFSEEEEISW